MTHEADRRDLAAHSLDVLLRWQTDGGAFIAGPTFSQYGFSWFRDGSFIAEALDLCGRLEEAGRFHAWASRVILDGAAGMERAIVAAGEGRVPDGCDYLHCRYTVDGEPGPDDWPTFQLDGPGIWLWSLDHHVRCGGTMTVDEAAAARLVGTYLAALRDTPAADAWEEAPDRVHTSTRGAMLAGLRAIAALGLDEPATADARDALERQLIGRRVWAKWDGSDAVDASLLWLIAPYGTVDVHAPVAAATVARIEAELEDDDGGVHRYRDDTYYGGGAWPLLSVALARVRLLRDAPGDRELARRALAWIEAQADAHGDLPEQTPTLSLHPERIEEWTAAWGPSARPLLWSHATYLILRRELGLWLP